MLDKKTYVSSLKTSDSVKTFKSLNYHNIFKTNSTVSNKNVDIKFSVHDTFLEQPPSGTPKTKRLES